MSLGEEKHPALVVAQSSALTKAGAHSLAARGRDVLRRKGEAAEWLRKGLEMRDTAPEDPFGLRGPINPYATGPADSGAQLLKAAEYVKQIEGGNIPGHRSEELAHVARRRRVRAHMCLLLPGYIGENRTRGRGTEEERSQEACRR
jgi:hypothetical protein